jgi:hypothetical protein
MESWLGFLFVVVFALLVVTAMVKLAIRMARARLDPQDLALKDYIQKTYPSVEITEVRDAEVEFKNGKLTIKALGPGSVVKGVIADANGNSVPVPEFEDPALDE